MVRALCSSLIGRRYVLCVAAFWVALAILPSSARTDEVEAEAPAPYHVKQNVAYANQDGKELLLDAYLPEGEGPFPAVLVVHGGAWRSGGKGQLAGYARTLARRGYAAFAINYRLAPQYKFPAQLEDCRAAVRWIRDNAGTYRIDPRRVGGIGYSAGGHLVALLATRATAGDEPAETVARADGAGEAEADSASPQDGPPLIDTSLQCVCAGGAPCDFRVMSPDSLALAFWLGGPPGRLPQLYKEASPRAWVTAKAPPMLFFHGAEDDLVPLSSPEEMVKTLQNAGVEAVMHVVEGAGHLRTSFHGGSLLKSIEFFDKHLGAAKEEP